VAADPAGAASEGLEYRAQFRVEIRPDEPVTGGIRVIQPDSRLRRLELAMPADRFSAIAADGRITRRGDTVTWRIPERGGDLRYRVAIDHRRNDKGYDALLTDDWAIFRAEDVFPGADAAFRPGTRARGELLFDLPPGWSVATPYLPDAAGHLAVDGAGRAYARPVGWFIVGKIGTRKDTIGDTTVRVAGPRDQDLPRVPTLALLRWTLPVLEAELPATPQYLLIVLADDPLWRGGLSAPNSLFAHARRPLISENGTSTLVHEIVHVVAPVPAAPDHDWIDEGIAEYVALVMLRRSDTISRERFEHAVDTFRRRGAPVRTMLTRNAGGDVKARAVAIFYDIDQELQARSRAQRDIFDLLRRMMAEDSPIDANRLRDIAGEVAGGTPLRALGAGRIPGVR
jgi:hypothetical protein